MESLSNRVSQAAWKRGYAALEADQAFIGNVATISAFEPTHARIPALVAAVLFIPSEHAYYRTGRRPGYTKTANDPRFHDLALSSPIISVSLKAPSVGYAH